jgi:hypothetical protein
MGWGAIDPRESGLEPSRQRPSAVAVHLKQGGQQQRADDGGVEAHGLGQAAPEPLEAPAPIERWPRRARMFSAMPGSHVALRAAENQSSIRKPSFSVTW